VQRRVRPGTHPLDLRVDDRLHESFHLALALSIRKPIAAEEIVAGHVLLWCSLAIVDMPESSTDYHLTSRGSVDMYTLDGARKREVLHVLAPSILVTEACGLEVLRRGLAVQDLLHWDELKCRYEEGHNLRNIAFLGVLHSGHSLGHAGGLVLNAPGVCV